MQTNVAVVLVYKVFRCQRKQTYQNERRRCQVPLQNKLKICGHFYLIHRGNFLFTFVNTKSIYGFQYFEKLPFGPFIKIDDVANTEFKIRDPIHIPEGCTFPDGYKQCMEDYPGPDDEYDWEGICYEVNCS